MVHMLLNAGASVNALTKVRFLLYLTNSCLLRKKEEEDSA